LKKLFDFGLTTILISVYDSEFDALAFESMCNSLGLTDGEDYLIRRRFLPAEQDFGITMSNRAGMLKNAEYKVMPLKDPLKKNCNYPAYTFFVDYNGDVLMCAHDWGKKRILGNLNKKTFYEIWNSQYALISRKKLLNKDRNFSPCNVCDVQGELIGNEHAAAWLAKLNEKNNTELKQKKVIKFVKNYFSKNNSPFLKENYFALYENGEGYKKIKEKVFNTKQIKNIKYYISNIANLISIFKYDILAYKKKNFFIKI
jgi:radical SAM protein with 4Fe4S-binding SPASM domain